MAVAVLLELFYFNASYFYGKLRKERPYNITLSLADFETQNWEKTSQGMRSQPDPILIRSGLNMDVTEVEIAGQTNRPIPYVFVFYTDPAHPEFCEETMVSAEAGNHSVFTARLPGQIRDIRVDLGDDPGLELYALSLCINPLRLEFSVARFTAMLVVCFGFWGLTRLQSSPEYSLMGIGESKGRKEGED